MNVALFLAVASVLLGLSVVQATLDQSKFSPKLKDLVVTLRSTCMSRSGTDDGAINKVIKGEFNDEPKIKVYMKCLLTESTVMSESGDWNYDVLSDLLGADINDKAISNIKSCDASTNSIGNLDDRAFAFLKCTYEKNPDIFIFF